MITNINKFKQINEEHQFVNIDWNNFVKKDLQSLINADIFFNVDGKVDILGDGNYTIGDLPHFNVNRGSENLYLDIDIYNVENDDEHELQLWTKENHKLLKEFINQIINKL